MRFELPSGAAIEIADPQSAEEGVAAVCAHEGIRADIEALAAGAGYRRYECARELPPGVAGEIACALVERGREAADEFIANEIVDEYRSGPERFFHETMTGGREFGALLDALAGPIEDAFGIETDVASAMIVEGLKDRTCDALAAADDSKPIDVVPPHLRVEMYRIFGIEDGADADEVAFDDYVSNVMSLRSVMPGEAMKRLFEGVNADFDAFVSLIGDAYGVNLRGGAGDAALVDWLAAGDYLRKPDDPRVRSDAAARAAAWQAFAPAYDPDLPTAAADADLHEILENSSKGGLPCYVCRLRLADLMKFDWTQPIMTAQSGSRISGGFVGIFEPFNGSGHLVRAESSVMLPPGRAGWRVSGVHGVAVDKVFENVGGCYHADLKVDERRPAPAHSPAGM